MIGVITANKIGTASWTPKQFKLFTYQNPQQWIEKQRDQTIQDLRFCGLLKHFELIHN